MSGTRSTFKIKNKKKYYKQARTHHDGFKDFLKIYI